MAVIAGQSGHGLRDLPSVHQRATLARSGVPATGTDGGFRVVDQGWFAADIGYPRGRTLLSLGCQSGDGHGMRGQACIRR